MQEWPSDLDESDRQTLEAAGQRVRERVFERLKVMLGVYEDEATAQYVYDRAMTPNDLFRKREQRPKIDSALLTAQVYREFGDDEATLDALLDLAILTQEYYDILDDVVDGDVADGRQGEAILTSQLLLPRLVECLAATCPDCAAFWAERIERLVTAPRIEFGSEPSADAYLDLLDRQSNLYGVLTGLAALAAGASDASIEQAEEIGALVYKHDQLVLDWEQHTAGARERWNAGALMDIADVADQLRTWRGDVESLTESFDDERATVLRGLVALDVEAWRRQ